MGLLQIKNPRKPIKGRGGKLPGRDSYRSADWLGSWQHITADTENMHRAVPDHKGRHASVRYRGTGASHSEERVAERAELPDHLARFS